MHQSPIKASHYQRRMIDSCAFVGQFMQKIQVIAMNGVSKTEIIDKGMGINYKVKHRFNLDYNITIK